MRRDRALGPLGDRFCRNFFRPSADTEGMDLAQHVNCQLQDKRVIAPTAAQRLMVMRIIFSLARGFTLLAVHLVDSHLHFLALESRRRSMELARRMEGAITRRLKLPVGFVPAYPEPVRNQRHLYRAFDYILRQQSKHGLAWDPYLESSNVLDLLGMRQLGDFTAKHVREHLPRIAGEGLLGYYGLERLQPGEASLTHLAAATCSAAGLGSLKGRSIEARHAKIAAVAVGYGQMGSAPKLAAALGVHERTIRKLHQEEASSPLVEAIRWQLGLREALAAPRERDTFVAG